MNNFKKSLVVSLYLVAIVGLGISSLVAGRRIAERQRRVTPTEIEAGAPAACLKCCGYEPGVYGPDDEPRWACGGCAIRKPKDCSGNRDEPEDCWAPQCVSCENLTADKTDFQIGKWYTFQCSGESISWGNPVTKYKYRAKLGNQVIKEVTKSADSGPFQLKIEEYGNYTVQCQACTNLGCSPWENL